MKTTQIVDTARCPKCKCTDHDKYRLVNCVAIAGTTSRGEPYTHVVTRRTKCTNCKFLRRDKFFENHAPAASPGEENEPEATKSPK